MNQQFYKNMALWVVILVMILLLVTMLRQSEAPPPELAYSDFLARVEAGDVQSVLIEEGHISGQLERWQRFQHVRADRGRGAAREAALPEHRDPRAAQAGGQLLAPGADDVVPDAADRRALGVLHAPDAGGRRQGDELRQVARAAAHRESAPGDVRRRRGRRGGEGRARGDHRLPGEPEEVHAPRRADSRRACC